MKILFDHNVPKRLRRSLPGHDVFTTRQMHWDMLANGRLIRAAVSGSFDAIITIDKKIEFEQNLATLPLPIIVIDAPANTRDEVAPFFPTILKLLESPLTNALHVVLASGSVLVLTKPRTGRES